MSNPEPNAAETALEELPLWKQKLLASDCGIGHAYRANTVLVLRGRDIFTTELDVKVACEKIVCRKEDERDDRGWVDWSGWNIGEQGCMHLSGESGDCLAEISDLGIVDGARMYRAKYHFENGGSHTKQFLDLSLAMDFCAGDDLSRGIALLKDRVSELKSELCSDPQVEAQRWQGIAERRQAALEAQAGNHSRELDELRSKLDSALTEVAALRASSNLC